MKRLRSFGRNGPAVGAVGCGAMGLEGYYGSTDEENAVNVIRHALDEGCSLIDTADAYGNGHNEQLVGRAVANRRSEAFIATKFGIVFDPDETGTDVPTGWGFSLSINGKPEYIQRALEKSLEMKLAEELGITAAQLSLAWLLHQDKNIIPIPGTRRRKRVTENAQAAEIILNPETVRKISELAAPGLAQGQTLL